ncbi:MAG: zinc ribbon domain-containing protein [Pseudomonadota bacterium]
MPNYDYRCEATGRVVEVKHSMNIKLTRWGELCALAGIEPGDTPPDSPVTRLITGGNVVKSSALKNPDPPCGSGACGSGRCQMH